MKKHQALSGSSAHGAPMSNNTRGEKNQKGLASGSIHLLKNKL